MKILTIQNKDVLNTLKQNKIYYANRISLSENLKEVYTMMMNHYNYVNSPIFGCIIGRYAEFYGANIENGIILELDIPDQYVKKQVYYDWTDLIYFMEFPEEFTSCSLELDDFMLDVLNGKNTEDLDKPIQVTFPHIDPKWLINSYEITNDFTSKYYGAGGQNILKCDFAA